MKITEANSLKTHCPTGHEYTGEHLIRRLGKPNQKGKRGWTRECRTCTNYQHRKYFNSPAGQATRHRGRVSYTRNLILDKLGAYCRKCGFTDRRALQIDHVNGAGTADRALHRFDANSKGYYRKVLKDETGMYQILCANCNWIKRYVEKECPSDLGSQSIIRDNK